uniref:Uncharacterized protein n=1 Tax=Anopheles minimus TaxID=112268 RepID=A0A182WPB5_9DIPT
MQIIYANPLPNAPGYAFHYTVNSRETNDVKSHEESRVGDAVVGKYSVLDPDGYIRTVLYTVDENKGFQAKVSREPELKTKSDTPNTSPQQSKEPAWAGRRRRLFRLHSQRKQNGQGSAKHYIIGIIGLVAVVCGQNHYGTHNDVQHDVAHYHHDEEHHGPAHYEYHYDVHDDHTGDHYHHEEEHHGPVHYEYHYDVHDDHTGDVHGQKEARKDDSTQGEYYLIDADGHKRTVTYHVDGKSGFIAQVHREPIKGYQAPQPQHHYQHQAPAHQHYHH